MITQKIVRVLSANQNRTKQEQSYKNHIFLKGKLYFFCSITLISNSFLKLNTVKITDKKRRFDLSQVHPSASTFVLNILQHLKILVIILAYDCKEV